MLVHDGQRASFPLGPALAAAGCAGDDFATDSFCPRPGPHQNETRSKYQGPTGARRAILAASGISIILGYAQPSALGAEVADAVAMVIGINGATNSTVRQGDLIEEGREVTLEHDAQLTFYIFGKCGLFTAAHGKVTFLRREAKSNGYTLVAGPGPCTKFYELREREPMVGGGLTLRHGGLPLQVSARPQFLLGGPGATRVVAAQLVPKGGDGGTAKTMALAGRGLTLRHGDLPLLNNRTYTLKLGVSSGKPPEDLSLEVTDGVLVDVLDVLVVN
jgi:hypothetical protein